MKPHAGQHLTHLSLEYAVDCCSLENRASEGERAARRGLLAVIITISLERPPSFLLLLADFPALCLPKLTASRIMLNRERK